MTNQINGQLSSADSIKDSDFFPNEAQNVLNILEKFLFYAPALTVLPMIVTAAAAVGSSRNSSIGGYPVKPILYGCTVGNPGTNKSAPLTFATKPLYTIFKRHYAGYQQIYKEWQQGGQKGKEPMLPEIIFSDITIEKVGFNLKHNPRGALLAADELKGWLNSFARYSSGSAEQKYLELWNGTPLIDSRMGRQTVFVPAPYLSVIGTTQPDTLHRTFAKATDNGLKERIIFTFSDAQPRPWNREASTAIKADAQTKWTAIIERLYRLKPDSDGRPVYVPFASNAEDELYQWNAANNARKIAQPQLAAICGKADVICPRLALVLQMLDDPDSRLITADNAIRAINLMEYFLANSLKAMQIIREGVPDPDNPKRRLYELLPPTFTAAQAKEIATTIALPERTLMRYLNDINLFSNVAHGAYKKVG